MYIGMNVGTYVCKWMCVRVYVRQYVCRQDCGCVHVYDVVCLFVCLSACLSVYLSFWLPVCLSAYVSVYPSVFLVVSLYACARSAKVRRVGEFAGPAMTSTTSSGKTSAVAAADDDKTTTTSVPSSSSSAPPRVSSCLWEAVSVCLDGVRDALMLHRCVFFLARSEVIRFRTLQCFMLNGVIFLGSIIVFHLVVEPALGLLQHLVQPEEAWATNFVAASFAVLYKMLWIYPIYCISYLLNMVMYQEIADSAVALAKNMQTPQPTPALTRLINEVYRSLASFVYLVEMSLLLYVPVLGPMLYFIHSCWLASIYCFEYRWVHLQWTSNQRVEYFESHWLYFAGFGFPMSLVCFWCPRFVDVGVFALLFPLFILQATSAEPCKLRSAPRIFRRLPVFFFVQGFCCSALKAVEGYLTPPSQAVRKKTG
eukprot:TRINITY_DN60725_c0_g1_i2.p1 TRINITY_DN60725_c0_g1~~TRINITY_DN60725_c0_g1_i2.p1  ORF type:complete len:424 (-),score=28.53 TRINITY_DN60725_c0_g1_i2:90-1361(-)